MDSASADRPVEDPPRPELPGYQVGSYLGGGASGAVWEVTRSADDFAMAAKVLTADVEQASAEAAVVQRLRHEHVIRVHDTVLDLSQDRPRLVLITDLAGGGTLGQVIAGRGHLSVGELVTVLTPIARTLHDLHGQGLIHGDLSPSNVLLDAHGKPLLADFGVARLTADSTPHGWGSEGFVAPEVLSGHAPNEASDVYALGALAWTALVGSAPPPAALRPDLAEVAPQASSRLHDLVLSTLSHTPQARPTAGEFTLALWDCGTPEQAPVTGAVTGGPAAADPWAGLTQRVRERAVPELVASVPPWHRRRRVRAMVIAAAVAGVALGGLIVWRDTVQQPQHPQHQQAGGRTGAGVPAVTSATPARPATPRSSAPVPTPAQPAGGRQQPSRPTVANAAAAQRLRAQTQREIQELVDARAAAWTGSLQRLDRALLVGSGAWRNDQRDLQSAAAAGAQYTDLRFTVTQARVRRIEADRAQVQVEVDRSSYQVRTAQGVQRQPALAQQRTTLDLQLTGQGWRIADWGQAA